MVQSETVIASIGSFLTSLLPPTTEMSAIGSFDMFTASPTFTLLSTASDAEALRLRNKHVFILSLTGTIARLLTGITADYLSPPLVAVPAPPSNDPDAPDHMFIRKRKQILPRSLYAAISALLLAAIFGWSSGFLKTERGLWVLSAGTGGLYGALFTLSVRSSTKHCLHLELTCLASHRFSAFRTDKLWPGMGHGLVLCKLLSSTRPAKADFNPGRTRLGRLFVCLRIPLAGYRIAIWTRCIAVLWLRVLQRDTGHSSGMLCGVCARLRVDWAEMEGVRVMSPEHPHQYTLHRLVRLIHQY